MNILDSSAWLEYFADGLAAAHFAKLAEKPHELLVPVITLYEVMKVISLQRSEEVALPFIAHMRQGEVITIDIPITLLAAKITLQHRLPLADSLIYATAQYHGAILWTQDADFHGLEGVRFFSKES